jgi:hypothetical protein
MHGSHLPLRTWFLAAHIITSHSNGMSARQLQAQLGLGSYKTAWLLLHKLRRAMVNPDRNPLKDIVEIDETEMLFRSWHDPVDRPKGGRSPVGKMYIVGAVELSEDGEPRRIRMKHIPECHRRVFDTTARQRRCTVSSARPSSPERISSRMAGSVTKTSWQIRMRRRSSLVARRTKSCTGFIACSPT